MKRIVSCISVMLLVLSVIPAITSTVMAENEDPNAEGKVLGPWIISASKSYKDRTIEVGGNITIKSGGTLKLDNVSLIMNSTPVEEFFITVLSGGSLQVLNGSVITNNATYDKPFFVMVNQGAQLTVNGSHLRRMGNTSATIGLGTAGRMGLLIQSTGATIRDSLITDSYAGTVCMNLVAVTPTIINTTYMNNTIGMGLSMGCTPVMHDNTYVKNGVGLAVMFKPLGQTGLIRDKFTNNTMAIGATGSLMSLKDLVIENSSQIGIGAMANSHIDLERVVLKGNMNATYMDNSTMLFKDSSITGSSLWDFFVDNVSFVVVLNSTLESTTKIKVNDTDSTLEVQWYLNVLARTGPSSPVVGAYVNLTDAKGARAFSTATNATGWTGQFVVTEIRDKGAGAVRLTPHNVTAEKGAFWNRTEVVMDRSQDLVLDLWERDLVAPSISIDQPVDGAFVNTTKLYLAGMAFDNRALAVIELDNGTGSWAGAMGLELWEGNVTLAGDGAYSVCARATDTSGNNATTCIEVTLDTVGPLLTVTEPLDGSSFNHSQMFVTGTTDADEVTVNGEAAVIFDGNFTYPLTLTKEGLNVISLVARDKAGNTNSTSIKVYRDLQAPSIVVLSPLPGAVVPSLNFVVAGNATDAQGIVSVWGSPDNQTWKVADVNFTDGGHTSGAFTAGFLLDEGPHTIYLKAIDLANNVATVELNITIKLPDTEAPAVVISEPKDGDRIVALVVLVRGTSSDNERVSRVELGLDGVNWTPAESYDSWAHWSLNISLGAGSNTIYARALDLAGNKKVAMVTVTAEKPFVDTEKPVITISSHKDNQVVKKNRITLRGAVSDNVKVKAVYVSTVGAGTGAQWVAASVDTNTKSWSLDVPLKKGWNEVAVQAQDDAGNTNTTIISIKYEKTGEAQSLNVIVVAVLFMVLLVLAVVYVLTIPGRERSKKAKAGPSKYEDDESVDDEEE